MTNMIMYDNRHMYIFIGKFQLVVKIKQSKKCVPSVHLGHEGCAVLWAFSIRWNSYCRALSRQLNNLPNELEQKKFTANEEVRKSFCYATTSDHMFALCTQQTIFNLSWEILSHAAYSPDLVFGLSFQSQHSYLLDSAFKMWLRYKNGQLYCL